MLCTHCLSFSSAFVCSCCSLLLSVYLNALSAAATHSNIAPVHACTLQQVHTGSGICMCCLTAAGNVGHAPVHALSYTAAVNILHELSDCCMPLTLCLACTVYHCCMPVRIPVITPLHMCSCMYTPHFATLIGTFSANDGRMPSLLMYWSFIVSWLQTL